MEGLIEKGRDWVSSSTDFYFITLLLNFYLRFFYSIDKEFYLVNALTLEKLKKQLIYNQSKRGFTLH